MKSSPQIVPFGKSSRRRVGCRVFKGRFQPRETVDRRRQDGRVVASARRLPLQPSRLSSFGTLPYTGRAKKATPSASHSFGTSLKEGGRENCRKTLDGTRPGVLKYPQSNEQSRCGGKSTVFRPAREAPPGLEGRSGRDGNVRLPRLRPGAMSAASRRYRENEEEGNFLEIKWNRASLRLYTMYRGRRIFLIHAFLLLRKTNAVRGGLPRF